MRLSTHPAPRRLPRVIRHLRVLGRDRSGTAMIEFAILAPVLFLMYTGSFVISDMVTCGRKVSLAARTITDLTSQYGSVSPSDLTAVLSNSAYVLAPYNSSNATLTISEVQVTDASHATVVWSQSQINNQTAAGYTVGTIVNLPVNLAPALMLPNPSTNPATPGGYFIMGEISYTYTPLFGQSYVPPTKMYNRYFMLPRLTSYIPQTS